MFSDSLLVLIKRILKMNNDLCQIIKFYNEYHCDDEKICIQNLEKILDDKNSPRWNFFTYIITHYSDASDIYVQGDSIFGERHSYPISLRTMGIMSNVGSINKNGIATINDVSFSVLDEFSQMYDFNNSDALIKYFYVPSKGIYRLRMAGLGDVWTARILCVYKFNNDEDKENIVNEYKVTNKFDVHFTNTDKGVKPVELTKYTDEKIYNTHELKILNPKKIHNKIYLNQELLDVVKNMTEKSYPFKFKLFPTIQKENGAFKINLIYNIYIITESLDSLLSFMETNLHVFNEPFFEGFYSGISDIFYKVFNVNIDLNKDSNIEELRNFIKTIEY